MEFVLWGLYAVICWWGFLLVQDTREINRRAHCLHEDLKYLIQVMERQERSKNIDY